MKKNFLIAIALVASSSFSYAQVTTDPATNNVGIGTATPAAQLHVFGPGQSTGNLSPGGSLGGTLFLQDSNGAPGNGGAVLFGSIFGPFAGIKGLVQDGHTYTVGDLAFSTRVSTANSYLTERMRITFGGNVGIGTPSPDGLLTINGPLSGGSSLTFGVPSDPGNTAVPVGTTTGGYNIDFHTWRDVEQNQIGARIRAERINGYSGGNALVQSMDLTFHTSNGGSEANLAERLRIRSDGNVGIGTADPGIYKLAVNGTIHSKKVIIDLIGWPDYVFNPTYNLKPLSEVKAYIVENHHLPEMPSEKEVADKGVDLGEINKLLTKKVEELTLYLIDQQKQIDQLKKQMEAKN
jgi:hypothetical protein